MFRRILLLLVIITISIAIYNSSQNEPFQSSILSMQNVSADYVDIQNMYNFIVSRLPLQFDIGSVRTYELGDNSANTKRPQLSIDGPSTSNINLHFQFDAPPRGADGPKGEKGEIGGIGPQGETGQTGPSGYPGCRPHYWSNIGGQTSV